MFKDVDMESKNKSFEVFYSKKLSVIKYTVILEYFKEKNL